MNIGWERFCQDQGGIGHTPQVSVYRNTGTNGKKHFFLGCFSIKLMGPKYIEMLTWYSWASQNNQNCTSFLAITLMSICKKQKCATQQSGLEDIKAIGFQQKKNKNKKQACSPNPKSHDFLPRLYGVIFCWNPIASYIGLSSFNRKLTGMILSLQYKTGSLTFQLLCENIITVMVRLCSHNGYCGLWFPHRNCIQK